MTKIKGLPELTMNEYEQVERRVKADLWQAAKETADKLRLSAADAADFVHRSVGTYVTPRQVEVFLETAAGAAFALTVSAQRAGVDIADEIKEAAIYDLVSEAKRVTFRLGRYYDTGGAAAEAGGPAA